MIASFLVTAVLLLVAFIAMAAKILFTKNGKFPNTHIGASKAMKDRGITCATSQDREAQKSNQNQK